MPDTDDIAVVEVNRKVNVMSEHGGYIARFKYLVTVTGCGNEVSDYCRQDTVYQCLARCIRLILSERNG